MPAQAEVGIWRSFRKFAEAEKAQTPERRILQSKQDPALAFRRIDRATKFKELVEFSESFKLRTPIPPDLVGILSNNATKQAILVEKSSRELRELAAAAELDQPTTKIVKAEAAKSTSSKLHQASYVSSDASDVTFAAQKPAIKPTWADIAKRLPQIAPLIGYKASPFKPSTALESSRSTDSPNSKSASATEVPLGASQNAQQDDSIAESTLASIGLVDQSLFLPALYAALTRYYRVRWAGDIMLVANTYLIQPPYGPGTVQLLPGKTGNLERVEGIVRFECSKATTWVTKTEYDRKTTPEYTIQPPECPGHGANKEKKEARESMTHQAHKIKVKFPELDNIDETLAAFQSENNIQEKTAEYLRITGSKGEERKDEMAVPPISQDSTTSVDHPLGYIVRASASFQAVELDISPQNEDVSSTTKLKDQGLQDSDQDEEDDILAPLLSVKGRTLKSSLRPGSSEGTMTMSNAASWKTKTSSAATSLNESPSAVKFSTAEVEAPLHPQAMINPSTLLSEVKDAGSVTTNNTGNMLSDTQKHDISQRFKNALIRELPDRGLMLQGYTSSNATFQRNMKELLKQYSVEIKSCTAVRTQRAAANSIRELRANIYQQYVEALDGMSPGDLVTKAEKLYPGEKTVKEKVGDWLLDAPVVDFELASRTHTYRTAQLEQNADNQARFSRMWSQVGEPAPISLPALSLSSFSSDVSASEDAVIHVNPTTDRELEEFLTGHAAFKTLSRELQRLLERECFDQMKVVRDRVLNAIRRKWSSNASKAERLNVTFSFPDWNLHTYLQQQYSRGLNQDIGSILTITGRADNAYLCTVRDYLQQMWPKHPSELLNALATPGIWSKKATTGDDRVLVDFRKKELLVHGSEDFIVSIAQQLAWLVASCRSSPDALVYSHASLHLASSLDTDAELSFLVASELSNIDPSETGGCWNVLVGKSTVVPGFRIPCRSDNQFGLEVSIDIMAALGGAPVAVEYCGGYVLKGRSIVFVPVYREKDWVQWHLLRKGSNRIRYCDIDQLLEERERLGSSILKREDLSSTRVFLGWIRDSQITLATESYHYSEVGYSKTYPPSQKLLAITGATVGLNHIVTGMVNFAFAKDAAPYSAERSTFYDELLDDASQIPVIFNDTRTHRSWQVDGELAILHMIVHRARTRNYQTLGTTLALKMATETDPGSVRQAMLDNANCVVAKDGSRSENNDHNKLFRDVVLELYNVLEGLQAHAVEVSSAGLRLKSNWRKHIHGYEYMQIVEKKHNIQHKEAQLRKTCGEWPAYARDIGAVILFGVNLGEVILPAQQFGLCPMFLTAPRNKDYLVVETSVLRQLFCESGCLKDKEKLTTTGIRWHRSRDLFNDCPPRCSQRDPCKCQRIQHLIPRRTLRVWNPPSDEDIKPLGAVIFGQVSRGIIKAVDEWFTSAKDMTQETVENPEFSPDQVITSQGTMRPTIIPLSPRETRVRTPSTLDSGFSPRMPSGPRHQVSKPSTFKSSDLQECQISRTPKNEASFRGNLSGSSSSFSGGGTGSSSVGRMWDGIGTDLGSLTPTTSCDPEISLSHKAEEIQGPSTTNHNSKYGFSRNTKPSSDTGGPSHLRASSESSEIRIEQRLWSDVARQGLSLERQRPNSDQLLQMPHRPGFGIASVQPQSKHNCDRNLTNASERAGAGKLNSKCSSYSLSASQTRTIWKL